MTRRLPGSSTAKRYTLQITGDIARQLQRCRASIRRAIAGKLQEILATAAARPLPVKGLAPGGPPLRFYVLEGYRVSYVVRPRSRTVTVLDIQSEPG